MADTRRICRQCYAFNIQGFIESEDYTHMLSVEAVIAGKNENCSFCSLLHQDFEDSILRLPTETRLCTADCRFDVKLFTNTPSKGRAGFTNMTISMSPRFGQDSFRRKAWFNNRHVIYSIAADPGWTAASTKITGRYLGEDPKSDLHRISTIEWLENCLQQHTDCQKTLSQTNVIDPNDAILPTRCLDVSNSGTGRVILVEFPRDQQVRGKYITLSHRWQTPETTQSMTNSSNYRDRTDRNCGIMLASLPKVFQSAIAVARMLRVKYLWIDSLCIIQNSIDFQTEKIRVAQYYQYAYFTIATTVTSCGDDFLSHRAKPSYYGLAQLPYRSTEGRLGDIFYVLGRPSASEDFRSKVRDSDLLTRGWVFQEWLLSRRIIFYTPAGMFFECQTDRPVREGGEEVLSYDFHTYAFKRNFKVRRDKPLSTWYILAQSYARLDLTKPEDHIWALAGLAVEMKEALAALSNINSNDLTADCCSYAVSEHNNSGDEDEGRAKPGDGSPSEDSESLNESSSVTAQQPAAAKGKTPQRNAQSGVLDEERPLGETEHLGQSTRRADKGKTVDLGQESNNEGRVKSPHPAVLAKLSTRQEVLEYASGLWLSDIHHGLLWEQVTAGPNPIKRECAIAPSWSWMSLFTEVTWPERAPAKSHSKYLTVAKLTYWNPVDQNIVEVHKSDNAARPFYLPAVDATEHFDISAVCIRLTVRSKCVLVRVKKCLDRVMMWTAAVASHESRWLFNNQGKVQARWHAVVAPDAPGLVVGWGSFERNVGPHDDVYAVHVATRRAPDGISYGYISKSRPVYEILFCVEVVGGEFRRVGVGRIFAKNVIQGFEAAEMRELVMV
ncbi:uncharacterized protein Z518_04594 [Rhinocladiella mackenziei CBS 650.93]|uniref:Heterokaryon incompatibility domain-containing protein n=1 Tax=Rhinocladiella mackenziei CBS 650.93 TaxID=1442369 RepID=A0A0D2H868_9EURO|nr:uncharacterized protein Z518_04594 [Rhinocladiella mackenziei CBS 650.93]KIX06618.1 hypothetical protein Z518_04594 [Rhinocladiella mackenziei CBS 650.93]